MLKMVDLLVGMSVIMLFLSMAVTLITQLIGDALNTRGSFLRGGVSELLHLIDNGIGRRNARIIADYILRDELVATRFLGTPQRRLATVVHREELTKLILGFAVDLRRPLPVVQQPPKTEANLGEPEAAVADARPTRPLLKTLDGVVRSLHALNLPARAHEKDVAAAQTVMRASLLRNGVTDAAAALKDIRMAALRLEKSDPQLSNAARTNKAILDKLETDFIGKLNGWFDQTIDRVTDRFTAWTRGIAVVGALIVAFGLQVDTLALIDRLTTDDATRNALVSYALKQDESYAKAHPGESATQVLDRLNKVAGAELVPVPGYLSSHYRLAPVRQWDAQVLTAWRMAWGYVTGPHGPGTLLTVVLLSLGAPFWYGTLKSLVRLRSTLADKDDAQRIERQTTQGAPS